MKKLAMITVILLVAVMAFSFSDDLYRRMVRGDDSIAGNRYDFTGKIQQWMQEGDGDVYMIHTKDTGYSYYGHTIFLVVLHGSPVKQFIEGDTIIIKNAKYISNFSYETVLGATKTIPLFAGDEQTVGFLK